MRATSVEEGIINNEQKKDVVKDENDEANIAIELLDVVLKAASDETANLSQSINDNVVEEIEVAETEHNNDYNGRENRYEKENENIKIMENRMNDINRDEIESEIDEILREAVLSIAENGKVKLKSNLAATDENKTITEPPENVFQNHEFLSHLNELISKSSSNQLSKTMTPRKSSVNSSKVLRHSKSVSDIRAVSSVESELNDDKNVEMHETENDMNKNEISHPPPLPSSEEEFTPRTSVEKIDEDSHVISDIVKDELEDDVTVNREKIRDKLEKLLQSAPSRLTLNAPVPLPRTKFDEKTILSNPEVNETPQHIETIKSKQKLLFSEVLKSIPHAHDDDDDEK